MAEAPAATLPEALQDAPEDELMERYARHGMVKALAEVIAQDMSRTTVLDADKIRGKAMDSLMRAESGDVIKLMLFKIYESQKPRLAVGCLLLAAGIKPVGLASERALATQQNVSPEHVSNGVQEWQAMLGLPRVEFQKSAEAIASYKTHHRSNAKGKK